MADASDTMQFLMNQFDTAPAGTREEAVMAKELSEAIHLHGLQTINQDFNYSSIGKTVFGAAMLAVALVSLLSGIHAGPLPVIMLILGILAAAVYGLEYCGIQTVTRLGTPCCSQNLIARHPAAPATAKTRPIVLIAHYDTPRADVMSTPVLRRLTPIFDSVTIVSMAVAILAMFLQVLPLPQVVKSVAYALDVVAALILLAGGLRVLWYRYLAPYTRGANDNMSGVAAVLGLLARVRPVNGEEIPQALEAIRTAREQELTGVGDARPRGTEQPEPAREDVTATGIPRAVLEDVAEEERSRRAPRAARLANSPVRHGADVLRSLGMVPESCEIEYEAVPTADETVCVPSPSVASRQEAASQRQAPAAEEPAAEPSQRQDASQAPAVPAAGGATVVLTRDEIQAVQAQAQSSSAASAVAPAAAVEERSVQQPLNVIISSDGVDAELRQPAALPRDVAQQQGTLLDDEEVRRESIINSPTWGTTSFTPVRQNRLILEDVPDPAVAAVDPYSVSSIETIGDYNPDDFSAMDFETGTHLAVTPAMLEEYRRQNESGFMNLSDDSPRKRKRGERGRTVRNSKRAAQMAAEMQEQSFSDWLGVDEGFDARKNGQQIGSWENFDNDAQATSAPQQPGADGFYPESFGQDGTQGGGRRWQGGAARTRKPREERQETPADADDADLRQAAMQLGDRDLVSHEIWFVLTGASEAQHAGMKAFLSEYDKRLRNAYFINLECVGAGRQSIVVEEGRVNHRKADRHLVNLFGAASTQINRPLALTRMSWRDTEATLALRRGFRGVTICGVEGDVPARARWTGDVPESVNPNKINDIVDILVEVIKKS